MDLNILLSRHQVALYNQTASVSRDQRRWASLCAEFYAGEICKLRRSVGGSFHITNSSSKVTAHG